MINLTDRRWVVVVFIVSMALLILRRPEAILSPAPALEEGGVFYVGTWFGSIPEVLFRPYAGYLHVLAHLLGYAERLGAPAQAPLIGALLAIAVQAGLAALLASDRLAGVIPDRKGRLLLAMAVVLMPAAQEQVGFVADIQRLLPLFWLALLRMPAVSSAWGRQIERGVACIFALSGAAGLVVLPLYLLRLVRPAGIPATVREHRIRTGILLVGCVAQGIAVLIDGRHTAMPPLSDWPVGIGGHLAAVMVGANVAQTVYVLGGAVGLAAVGYLLSLGGALGIRSLLRGPVAFEVLWVAGLLVVAGVTGMEPHATGVFLIPSIVNRYYIVTGVILGAGALGIYGSRRWASSPFGRWAAVLLGAAVLIGYTFDFRLPSVPNLDWATKSACLGGSAACLVPVYEEHSWTIDWPGSAGPWTQPRPGG
jgi:hypothetical protein